MAKLIMRLSGLHSVVGSRCYCFVVVLQIECCMRVVWGVSIPSRGSRPSGDVLIWAVKCGRSGIVGRLDG